MSLRGVDANHHVQPAEHAVITPARETGPRSNLRGDLIAGITVGAMLVPQAMAYASLAGLSPQVGLYAATLPLIAYALIGRSRELAVGPVAIVSLITATTLSSLPESVGVPIPMAAAVLAALVGGVHLALAALRLGSAVRVLSHASLVGFTAAAALVIALSQVTHLLGIEIDRSNSVVDTTWGIARGLPSTNLTTALVGAASLGLLASLKRATPRVPSSLALVVVSLVAAAALDLDERGVATVGAIPSGLPSLSLPTFNSGIVTALLPAAVIITVVGFMESTAVATVYARRRGSALDPNRELVALGAANVGAGLVGGYPVTGGLSRTAVNASAGARTQAASVVSAAVVVASIAWFTPLLAQLPRVALAAIIVGAVTSLVDRREVRELLSTSRADAICLVTTFTTTLTVGIELGIASAVVSSIATRPWRSL